MGLSCGLRDLRQASVWPMLEAWQELIGRGVIRYVHPSVITGGERITSNVAMLAFLLWRRTPVVLRACPRGRRVKELT